MDPLPATGRATRRALTATALLLAGVSTARAAPGATHACRGASRGGHHPRP